MKKALIHNGLENENDSCPSEPHERENTYSENESMPMKCRTPGQKLRDSHHHHATQRSQRETDNSPDYEYNADAQD